MRELLEDLVDGASRHADYADARYVQQRAERLSTRNGGVDELDRWDAAGIGIRVRIGGAWGFAAARGEGSPEAEAALERAGGVIPRVVRDDPPPIT